MKQPVEHKLSDYQPSLFDIKTTDLEFDLSPEATLVTNTMQMVTKSDALQSLTLDGEHIELLSVSINGQAIKDYQLTDTALTLNNLSGEFELVIKTKIAPQSNTRLEGLYRTSGNYCTQCEAEGFRTITYYLDRPDVLSLFTTKIIADKADNAVLLSNGNLIESGELENDRHYAVWQDPFKKPCYLFALVAGNLSLIEDTFTTKDNREIDLRIYVEPKNIDKCDHAMLSLKNSMKWDEDRFGLIYDLDNYMIVAVDDFNMGAMENKGLNVFNSKFVLAKPETATDVDYEGIEAVIGHEYFHNWTGNRVTCRDWFQLTLKEGLTVFRDQEFTADMLSPAVKRIQDVKRLRANQFPEDQGPMSHPIQPQSYIEMNNFYTMTVYEKGAEVVRLYHSLFGEAGFQKGMKLYFDRFDGQAVTVQDFRNAMADANNYDLNQMHNWYLQAGTPILKVDSSYTDGKLSLNFQQTIKNSSEEALPLMIPVRFGLLDQNGNELVVVPSKATESKVRMTEAGLTLLVTEKAETFEFVELAAQPTVSLLRGFSAPVILEQEQSDEDIFLLAKHDTDSFVRWESVQHFVLKEIESLISKIDSDEVPVLSTNIQEIFQSLLTVEQGKDKTDNAMRALLLSLPDISFVVDQFLPADPQVIYNAYQTLKKSLAKAFQAEFAAIYQSVNQAEDYVYETDAIGKRALKNVCLNYLVSEKPALALDQYEAQANMTDVWASLVSIVKSDVSNKADILQDFYDRWQDDTLVMDKWFSLQAANQEITSVEPIKQLLEHPDFSLKNPNRARSVLGVFGRMNAVGLHIASGEGYQLLADKIIELNEINPQVASRMVYPFTQWQKMDEKRQQLMKVEMERILAVENLSKDVFEIVSKSING